MKTPFEQPLDAGYKYVVFPDEIEDAIRDLWLQGVAILETLDWMAREL